MQSLSKAIFCILLSSSTTYSFAADETKSKTEATTTKALNIQPSETISGLLKLNFGKSVKLKVSSGEEIGGVVESVGTTVVHLRKVDGRDYYDAVVNISDIKAVIIKVRDK